MTTAQERNLAHADKLREILRRHWGYESFRPLQAEAMQSVLDERDSVVVLPTGGGKSLCFQAPAAIMPGLAVIVSPLISLMKDQVDALADSGVSAACVNSSLTSGEKAQTAQAIRRGELRLLYMSPERLMSDRTLEFLAQTKLSFIAIDEAHCISDWGHDFRPEYRTLSRLKEVFPGVGVHAYTATATPHVRDDIARELGLQQPRMLVGSFDRPNLVYRAQRRGDVVKQVREVVGRHPGESGIVYCIRRLDVETMCAALCGAGCRALPYHAGLDAETRLKNQDAFINDQAEIIVATVAFGMGIDKPDVRYVVHAAAPKSLESYQQESGRAGRDGLEAECVLFYSPADFQTWRRMLGDLPAHAYEIALTLLGAMDRYASGVKCRHQAIVNHFGQTLPAAACGACDVCLSELGLVENSLRLAQMILSCVVRLNQGFGGDYTALVLNGSREERILSRGHDKLSTWGLLKEHDKKHVRDWIEQLVSQGYLEKAGEYNVLQVTPTGRQVLKGEGAPRLLQPTKTGKKKSKVEAESWEGVDRGLFAALRGLRNEEAAKQGVPPYVVFGDATLRELAKYRPSGDEELLDIHGVGAKKLEKYGAMFLKHIAEYCREHDLRLDAGRS